METVVMYITNIDGKIIEKEVEKELVSTYKAIGWKIKEAKPIEKKESSFSSFKKYSK